MIALKITNLILSIACVFIMAFYSNFLGAIGWFIATMWIARDLIQDLIE